MAFDPFIGLETRAQQTLDDYIHSDVDENQLATELVRLRAVARQLGNQSRFDLYMQNKLTTNLQKQAPDKYFRFISYIQLQSTKEQLQAQLESDLSKNSTQIYNAQDVRNVQKLTSEIFSRFSRADIDSHQLATELLIILDAYPNDMAKREVYTQLERHGTLPVLNDRRGQSWDRLYTQLTGSHNSNENKYAKPKLNIENSRAIWDNSLEEKFFNSGADTMRGTEYLKSDRRTFRHLSNMITEIWNHSNYSAAARFDPQSRFNGNVYTFSDYIWREFSADQINRAHDTCNARYDEFTKRGRGRPKGSKNRPKFTKPDPLLDELQDSILDATDDVDHSASAVQQVEHKIDWDAPEQKQETQQAPKLDLSDLKRDLAEDMRDHVENVLQLYVSHTQLGEKRYINAEQAGAIFKPIHERLQAHIAEEFKKLNALVPRELVIVTPENVKYNMGVQHVHFPELLQMVQSRVSNDGGRCNIWLYGPAGTGKTTAAKNVSKALGMKFYIQSSLIADFQVIGHWDAQGRYSRTLFREAWEHGGIIMLDEIDAYQPGAAMALNGMLANGVGAFPDGMIERHKDCIIIAGANTTGLGASFDYVGRNKLDAATLDRFVFLDWPIDDVLEEHICNIPSWLLLVREVRANVGRGDQTRFKGVMITPRATIYGESLLRAGLSVERVIKATLKKGMSDAQWNMIKPSVSLIDMVSSEVTAAIHQSQTDAPAN